MTLQLHYQQAVVLPGLESERAARLVEHALRRNEALAGQKKEPLPPVVVRIAAVLMAARSSLSSPTALVEAEALSAAPGLGPALLNIQSGLAYLGNQDASRALEQDGLLRDAVQSVLRSLAAETQLFLQRLKADGHS